MASNQDDEVAGTQAVEGKAERTRSVQSGKKEIRGGMIAVYKYFEGRCKEDGERRFSLAPEGRI